MTYTPRLLFILLTSTLALTVAARPAEASCSQPPFAIAWSYPTDGGTGVPTDALLWILASGQAEVKVNGMVAAPGELPASFIAPGGLAPSTEYEVVVSPASAYGGAQPITFHFTTGAGPSTSAAPPALGGVNVARQAERELDAACKAVLDAGECYDTGPNEHVVFHSSSHPLVWIVQGVPRAPGETAPAKVWPGTCGDPEVFVHVQSDRCYELAGANEVGAVTRSGRICPGLGGASGCAVAGSGGRGAVGLALALGLLVLRRRLSRTRS